MADIIKHPGVGGGVAAPMNRFALVFEHAQPVMDALSHLRKVRNFIDDQERWDPKRNDLFGRLFEAIDIIPDVATLHRTRQLFHKAEHVPAPEEWYYLAFGVMLEAAPNSGKINVAYTQGLIESIMHDEELHRGYNEMGFSFAVMRLAFMDLRRTCKYVPAAQEVLEACDRQRRGFRKLSFDVDLMISVRKEAEAPPPETKFLAFDPELGF